MVDLSVIIPYCNEYPQIIFTIRAIAEELRGLDFEIIAINNYCEEAGRQERDYLFQEPGKDKPTVLRGLRFEDKGGEVVSGSRRACGFKLTALNYTKKLSHWNAKNEGIKAASGRIFYFVDSHVLPSRGSLRSMYQYYSEKAFDMHGTISLPLTYKILDSKRQIYKLFMDQDGSAHYKFTPLGLNAGLTLEVPCMSCCGVMITRNLLDQIGGGWPTLYGIYGGGENFFNFALRTVGIKSYVYDDGGVLYHHGEKRGYNFEYFDFSRNRAIAAYMVGGRNYLNYFLSKRDLDPEAKRRIKRQILNDEDCSTRRDIIKSNQCMELIGWLEDAKEREWLNGEENLQRFAELKEGIMGGATG